MPVTARLSRKFCETFGDDIANELVEWFNVVDATYRSELREQNELNFARFDARLGERVAEAESRLAQQVSQVESQLNQGMAGLEGTIRSELAAQRAEMIKWSCLFWMGMVVTVFVSRFIRP